MNGRNWMDLTMLAPGQPRQRRRRHAVQRGNGRGDFQLNVDGQQVTAHELCRVRTSPSSAATRSRNSSSSRTGSTRRQGRSTGMQVNAITQVGHEHTVGHVLRLFPQRQLQRRGLHPGPRAALLESADQRHVRRPDPAGPGALLRQLRVRARAADRSPSTARTRASTSTCPVPTKRALVASAAAIPGVARTRASACAGTWSGPAAVLRPGHRRRRRITSASTDLERREPTR